MLTLCYKGIRGKRNFFMEKINKSLTNQAVGLLPLLFFMIMCNYINYMLSLILGCCSSLICFFMFQELRKENIYQLLLIPTGITFLIFSVFFSFRSESPLYNYTSLIMEILLVIVIASFNLLKRPIYKWVRNSELTKLKHATLRVSFKEFYFSLNVLQYLFIIHLSFVTIFCFLSAGIENIHFRHFVIREFIPMLVLGFVLFEQVRMKMMRSKLKKEMWLPVLNKKGKVIGCIARSVSRSTSKKYYHPVVRVAVVYNGMLYLSDRERDAYISPEAIDYPYHGYVAFRKSLEKTIHELTCIDLEKQQKPHFSPMLNYTFENDKVKHMVNLYVLIIRSESMMNAVKRDNGKLWTARQIEDNLGKGLFSEYFEQEFNYLQQTVLLAENYKQMYKSGAKAEA